MAAFTAFALDHKQLRTNARQIFSGFKNLEQTARTEPPGGGNIRALVVPHSAWDVSGWAVAEAFRSCADRGVSRTVILAAIHDQSRPGLFLSSSDYFDTPLGALPVDKKTNEELASCSTGFEFDDIPHLTEISIEVILPFIKHCFPKTSIVPILMGSVSSRHIKALAGALRVVFGSGDDDFSGANSGRGKTLFIIPTCLAKSAVHDQAAAQAECFVRFLLAGDGKAIAGGIGSGTVSGCGAPLAAAFLESGLGRGGRLLPSGIDHVAADSGYMCYGSIILD